MFTVHCSSDITEKIQFKIAYPNLHIPRRQWFQRRNKNLYWTHLFQLHFVQIWKSQCLGNREFPELSKTHQTIICRLNSKACRNNQTKPDMLSCWGCEEVLCTTVLFFIFNIAEMFWLVYNLPTFKLLYPNSIILNYGHESYSRSGIRVYPYRLQDWFKD